MGHVDPELAITTAFWVAPVLGEDLRRDAMHPTPLRGRALIQSSTART